ncbi:hypothetical protein SVAN01_08749 [Stagonosporopsis vannaccii]|nr:hypothetical protein SVAN01_08749 [Stagonosporopsis vannaccii]
MQFTTFLLFLTSLATTTLATSPLPSNTHIRINTEPRLAIAKSRVSSTLVRSPVEAAEAVKLARAATNANADKYDHAAVHYVSNDIRDASTGALRAKNGMRGISRRGERVAAVEKEQRRWEDKVERQKGDMAGRRSGMGKARRVRQRGTRQQEHKQGRGQRRGLQYWSAKW